MRTRISSLNSFSAGLCGSSESCCDSGGTSSRRVASASLIFVRRAFSIREWLTLRWASRAARERVPGLRPRRFGGSSAGSGESSGRGRLALRGEAAYIMAGAMGRKDMDESI